MDPIIYQNYIYVHYHLRALLKEWKLLKPRFEAKLASSNSSSTTLLSLTQLKNRIESANLKLIRVIDQVQIISNIKLLDELTTALLRGPNIGFHLKDKAVDTIGEVDALLDKFNGIKPIAFTKLPYEFQNRLVALLPPPDLVNFKLAGKTATKYANQRGMFSECLHVIRNSIDYEDVKNFYGKNKYYDISSTSFFLKSSSCYVQSGLYLNLDSTEKFDRIVKVVRSCDYTHLMLHGPYTYKHAIYLMSVSKNLKYVCLSIGIHVEIEEYDDYYEAIVQWLNRNNDAIMITVDCPDLDGTFPVYLEERVKAQTNFNATFCDTYVVIYKQAFLSS
uniref:SIR2_2 domain-containing protein n=1 Tax=Panagrellus redivivus TaxID=6233 RepID=A0A7E4VN26_PANRE